MILTCIICGEPVGTIEDKNVPVRCAECRKPCRYCGGPAINEMGDACRCLLDCEKEF